jgi:hypothetical protein
MLITVQLPAHACGNTLSGEPDAGKSACPVRRGESGSHRKVSPSLLLYRGNEFLFGSGFAGLGSASLARSQPTLPNGRGSDWQYGCTPGF